MSSSADAGGPPPYHRRNSNQDLAVPMSDVQRMSMEDEARPLPDGWIRQFDPRAAHHFYVDTKAKPPRSIWIHPYDDEQYQREHNIHPPSGAPAISEKRNQGDTGPSSMPVPEKGGQGSSSGAGVAGSSTTAKGTDGHKRGFFEKIKDKAIGTKEEREAAKLQREEADREMQRRYMERRRLLLEQQAQQQAQYQQYYAQNGPLGRAGYANGGYPAPPMAYGRRGGGGFGGGFGVPLLGGLAGGLLLGDMMGGGFDGGGGGGFGGDGGGFGGDGGGGGFDGGGGF